MAADSPNELLERAVSGDRLATQTLLLRHHDHLVAAINAQLPNDLDSAFSAEDVCQDAYIVAIRSIGTFRGRTDEAFFAWLRTIAANKLTDTLRAVRALKRGGDGHQIVPPDSQASSMIALLDLLAMDERTPSQSVACHELVAAVTSAAEQLLTALTSRRFCWPLGQQRASQVSLLAPILMATVSSHSLITKPGWSATASSSATRRRFRRSRPTWAT